MKTDFEPDCPWCDRPMVGSTAIDGAAERLSCATCSIVVDLAPDPLDVSFAVAA